MEIQQEMDRKRAEQVNQRGMLDAEAWVAGAQVGGPPGDVILLIHRRGLLNRAGQCQGKTEDQQPYSEEASPQLNPSHPPDP